MGVCLLDIDQNAERKPAVSEIVELQGAAKKSRAEEKQHEREIQPAWLNQQRGRKEAEVDRRREPSQHREHDTAQIDQRHLSRPLCGLMKSESDRDNNQQDDCRRGRENNGLHPLTGLARWPRGGTASPAIAHWED